MKGVLIWGHWRSEERHLGIRDDPHLPHPAYSALGVALVLSMLFILLLRLVAGPVVLVLIVGVLGVLAYGIYHCWKEYQVLRDEGASINQLGFTTNLSAYGSVQETWLAASEYPARLLTPPQGPGLGPDPGPAPLPRPPQ